MTYYYSAVLMLNAEASGQDITDLVLDKLIAHPKFKDTPESYWIHPSAAKTANLKNYYEGGGFVQPEQWPQVSRAIFNFVRDCNPGCSQLSQAIQRFKNSGFSKGFRSGMLSPILSSLQPGEYVVINAKALAAIKLFSGVEYKRPLEYYPAANEGAKELLVRYEESLAQGAELGLYPSELFDLFAHWLSINPVYVSQRMDGVTDEIEETSDEDDLVLADEASDDIVQAGTLQFLAQPIYTLEQMAHDTLFHDDILRQWRRAIGRKGQIIFYGPPGTGKTFLARKLAKHLVGGGNGFWELMQFHPAYAYEDFIEGIRPRALSAISSDAGQNGSEPKRSSQDSTGGFTYDMIPGRFLQFCTEARKRTGLCVLIIDEINRAELSRVFGELMYLLEYRSLEQNQTNDFAEIPLAGGTKFQIPHNVRIIGTMNTADRSIALVDHALRRRFAFIPVYPDYDLLVRYHAQHNPTFPTQALVAWLKTVNKELDSHYALGVSFFLQQNLAENIEDIWKMEIEPYLEEYFFDRREKAKEFEWDKGELKNRLNTQSANHGSAAENVATTGDATGAPDNSPQMPSTTEPSNTSTESDFAESGLGMSEDEDADDHNDDEDESANTNSPAFAS